MTLKECYEEIGGNYEELLDRFLSEERVTRFVGMFLKDTSYQQLVEAMDSGDEETAFRMAHTLKGVCQNLSLQALYEISNEVTENLRPGKRNVDEAKKGMPELKKRYDKTIQGIQKFFG